MSIRSTLQRSIIGTTFVLGLNPFAIASSNVADSQTTLKFDQTMRFTIQPKKIKVDVQAQSNQVTDQPLLAMAKKQLTDLAPKTKWQVISDASQSVVLTGVVPYHQAKQLEQNLKANDDVFVDYTVTLKSESLKQTTIDQAKSNAKKTLTDHIYKTLAGYNHQLNAQYHIQSINFDFQQISSQSSNTIGQPWQLQASVVAKQTIAHQSASVLPPAYLQVDGFQQCLKSQSKGSWHAWCLPQNQPSACHDQAWEQLQSMDIPAC